MNNGINVLSLFDGLSGGRIALDQLGVSINNYYASEIDKKAIAVSKKNYPEIQHIGSVVDINPDNLPIIDLLIGGSPCQNFSFAGNQKGTSTSCNIEITTLGQYLELKHNGFEFEGQSYLFWEYIRIYEILKQKNPNLKFFLENVKMAKKWSNMFNETVGVDPIQINSEIVVPQLRNRLYWTNLSTPNPIAPIESSLSDILECGFVDRKKAYCIDANYFKGGNLKSYFQSSRRQLVFNDEESYFKGIQELESGNFKIKGLARSLTPLETERVQGLPDNYTLCDGISKSARYHMIGNGWTIPVIKYFFFSLVLK